MRQQQCRSRSLNRRRVGREQQGFSLIELMVTMVAMLAVVGAAMVFVIVQARHNTRAFARTSMQQTGRTAMALLSREIGRAGLGLPRRLAIRWVRVAENGCNMELPVLSVAGLDFEREWAVAATHTTTVLLGSPDPVPLSCDGSSRDVTLEPNEWLFLFRDDFVDRTSGTAGHGHGLLRVTQVRDQGTARIRVVDDYSSALSDPNGLKRLDLEQNLGGDKVALLRAVVSEFGVRCPESAAPYLYWSRNGVEYPVAQGLDLVPLARAEPSIQAEAGEVVGLRFRFHIDADADRLPDDRDGDEEPDFFTLEELLDAPEMLGQVVAVEVLMRLRGEVRQQQVPDELQTRDFLALIHTRNINTRTDKYIFLHNSAI